MSRLALGIVLLLTAAGCGGGTPPAASLPATVPVTGTVTLNGKPLKLASVKFVPRGSTKGVDCMSITDEAGHYELTQLRGGAGAPPGEYTVVINYFAKPDGSPVSAGPNDPPPADQGAVEYLPPKYSSFTESTLVAQVTPSGGEFKFDLKR